MDKTATPDNRKKVDWKKKNSDDNARISNRLQRREELSDKASTNNDTAVNRVPRATGLPLRRLLKKIKEIYDEDDDENETTPAFFQIDFLDEAEEQQQQKEKQVLETIRINKEQQLAGKLNLILSASMIAHEAGLPAKATAQDRDIIDSEEYDVKKIRRNTLKEKVEKPLKLKGTLPEKEISPAVKGIKKAKKLLSAEALTNMPAEDLPTLSEAEDEQAMARLILKKSGRKGPKKSLADIAKGLNKFENYNTQPGVEKENDDK